MQARAVGLAAGFVADRLLGDPATGHPVAAFGRFAQDVERRVWADDVLTGAAYTSVLVGGAGAVGAVIARATRRHPVLQVATTAATTWAVLGGRSLGREAEAVRDHLASGDLPAARRRLTHLVGRDTESLDESEISRAVVESVAENTSDAVVAPLLAGALAGVPGLVAYRAANTLDAMVGHRSERYVRFGRASARLDDLLNLVPSRLSALLAAALRARRRRQQAACPRGVATRRSVPPEPECRPGRGGLRRRARRPARRRQHLRRPGGGPAHAGRRPARRARRHHPIGPSGRPGRRGRPRRGRRHRCRAQSAAACGSLTTSMPAGLGPRRTMTTVAPRSAATCIFDHV